MSGRRTWLAVCGLASVWLAAAGCAQVLGVNGVEIGETDGASGSGGGTGAGGQGGSPPEICSNGKDDDGDGKIDCQDTECQSFQCLELAPDGWSGPVLASLGNILAPDCPSVAPTQELLAGYGTLTAPPATCSACSCSLDGVVCALPVLTYYRESSCGSVNYPSQNHTITAANQCVAPPFLTQAVSYRGNTIGQTAQSKPMCKPGMAMPTTMPPSFATQARLCKPSALGGGCQPMHVCAPKPGASGSDGAMSACITQAGDMPCPAGPYSVKTVVYGKTDDTRGCSACTCGPPSNVKCNGTTTTYTDNACMTAKTVVPHTNACTNSSAGSIKIIYTADPPTGSCSVVANGGQPNGAAMPAEPHTVCCTP
jgi:hypothetical protein